MSEELTINALELLKQLGISTAPDDIAVIPSEGMSFGAGSFIAPWTAQVAYGFMIDEDYLIWNRDNPDEQVPVPDICNAKGDKGWRDMYYLNYDNAKKAMYTFKPEDEPDPSKSGSGFTPNTYWVFTAPTAGVLNSRDLEKVIKGFGDTLVFATRVTALKFATNPKYPLKDRHQYGLMSLPGAVAAAADMFGFPNVGFDLSEFMEPEAVEKMDDEYFTKFCGDIRGGYKESILYQRRVALWESLGETNPKASAIIGAKTAKGNPNKEAATSSQLSACLSMASGKWKSPIYARVMLVPNPMATKEGKHYGLPVLAEIFKDEASARAAAVEELGSGANGDSQSAATFPATGGWGSAIPEDIVKYLVEHSITPLPEDATMSVAPPQMEEQKALRDKLVEDSFLESWELLVEWDAYAKEQG